MNYLKIFFLSISIFLLTSSCSDEGVSFGVVDYYPGFLWEESNISPVTKTFEFDFSQDAKDDNSTFAEFQFVGNDGKPISTDVMVVYCNGEQLQDNKFKIGSDVVSKELTFHFTPEAESGKHQGYLKLINHKLDRLDSQPLEKGQMVDAFQWTLYYDKNMNPLAECLMWIGIVLGLCLLTWLLVLKRMVYPTFGSIQKTFYIPGQAPLIVKFKGARRIVVSALPQKQQSAWNRFWTGKIVNIAHPYFTSSLTLIPSKGRKVLVKADSGTYHIMPNPMPGIGSAELMDIKNNLKININ